MNTTRSPIARPPLKAPGYAGLLVVVHAFSFLYRTIRFLAGIFFITFWAVIFLTRIPFSIWHVISSVVLSVVVALLFFALYKASILLFVRRYSETPHDSRLVIVATRLVNGITLFICIAIIGALALS